MPRKRILTEEEKQLWEEVTNSDFRLKFEERAQKLVAKPTLPHKKRIEDAPIKQNRLDLHGMTAPSAHHILITFIKQQYALQNRKLIIITGKGSGMLRDSLPQWLSTAEMQELVSCCEVAKAKDGGTGAYYVTLKKQISLKKHL